MTQRPTRIVPHPAAILSGPHLTEVYADERIPQLVIEPVRWVPPVAFVHGSPTRFRVDQSRRGVGGGALHGPDHGD